MSYGCHHLIINNWLLNFIVAAEKLEQAENQLAHPRFGSIIGPPQKKKGVSTSNFMLSIRGSISCLLEVKY